MATNTIQGKNAILSFYKNTFLPYKCFESVSVTVDAENEDVTTVGDGKWAKSRYKKLSWAVSLNGPLMIDTDNFTGFDLFQNQLGFTNVIFMISFYDSEGNIKSLQGQTLIQNSTFDTSATALVKYNTSLKGSGELKFFDGVIPCDSSITSITVTGQTSVDGIVHIAYTYSGAPYQVKYRVDGTGPYTYVLLAVAFDIPGLSIGNHTIEMIPVCSNGYEGTGLTQTFSVTQSLTCALDITTITVTGTGPVSITNNYTSGGATGSAMKYRIDGGAFVFVPNIQTVLNFGGLTLGAHTIEQVPICTNSVDGTGTTQGFNVTTGASYATINWSDTMIPGGTINFSIYKNGVQVVSQTATSSGSFTALNTDTINVTISINFNGNRDMSLNVTDSTTSAVLYNNNVIITPLNQTGTLTFSFSPTPGDTYSIQGFITP